MWVSTSALPTTRCLIILFLEKNILRQTGSATFWILFASNNKRSIDMFICIRRPIVCSVRGNDSKIESKEGTESIWRRWMVFGIRWNSQKSWISFQEEQKWVWILAPGLFFMVITAEELRGKFIVMFIYIISPLPFLSLQKKLCNEEKNFAFLNISSSTRYQNVWKSFTVCLFVQSHCLLLHFFSNATLSLQESINIKTPDFCISSHAHWSFFFLVTGNITTQWSLKLLLTWYLNSNWEQNRVQRI